MAYIGLVYAIFADLVIFDQTFVPMEIAGAAIITFFNLFTIWYKMRHVSSTDNNENSDANDIEQNGRQPI